MADNSISRLLQEAEGLKESDIMMLSRNGEAFKVSMKDAGFHIIMKERMIDALVVSGVDELLDMFSRHSGNEYFYEIQTGACFRFSGHLLQIRKGYSWVSFDPKEGDFTSITTFITSEYWDLSKEQLERDLGIIDKSGFFLYNKVLGTLYYKNKEKDIFAITVGDDDIDVEETVLKENYYRFVQNSTANSHWGFYSHIYSSSALNTTDPWNPGYTQVGLEPMPVVEDGFLKSVRITLGQGAIKPAPTTSPVFVRVELFKALARSRVQIDTFDIQLDDSSKVGGWSTLKEDLDGLQTVELDVSDRKISLQRGELIGVLFTPGTMINDLPPGTTDNYLVAIKHSQIALTTHSIIEIDTIIDEGIGFETIGNRWGDIDEIDSSADIIDEDF